MNKFKQDRSLKTKKSFQGTLNLNLNQHRCPKCFSALEAQVHSGTSTFYRYKSLDYYWIESGRSSSSNFNFKNFDPIKIVLNIKISSDEMITRQKGAIYSRSRAKIYDHHNILRKKRFVYSTVKPFLICKKCKYTKQLSFFTSKPDVQLLKKII